MERRQPDQLMSEKYQPSFQWTQDPLYHFLHVDLPGFKREEITVQIDQSGKLTIKGGKRHVGRGMYALVNQVFDVPNDTNIDRITGTFDGGHLTLAMPKKFGVEKEAPQKTISSKEEKEGVDEMKEAARKEVPQKTTPPDEKEELGKKKELGEKEEPQKTTPPDEKEELGKKLHEKKKELGEKEVPQKTTPLDKKKEVEEKEEVPQRYPTTYEKKKQQEEKEMQRKAPKPYEVKEEEEKEKEEKPKRSENGDRHPVGMSKWESVVCKWIDEEKYQGMVDNLLEKIDKHKTVIGVALVAFTVGFYVSHKLRTRGT